MPLNSDSGEVQIPAGFPGNDDSVLVTQHPHPDAIQNGWNSQVVRAPSDGAGNPSTGEQETVSIKPAEVRLHVDEGVASTTEGYFWRGRHVKEGSTVGDWTAWVGGSPRDNAGGDIRFARNLNTIDVAFQTTHKASTASVTVNVFDPFRRVNAIEFRKKDTSTGFPSTNNWSTQWDGSTGIRDKDTTLRRTERLPILTKHNSALDVQIRYHNETGKELKFDPGPFVFDQDDVAEISQMSLSLTTGGDATVSAGVDNDGEGNKIFVEVDGSSSVADPSTISNDGVINLGTGERGGRVNTGINFTRGSSVFAKARGQNDAGSLGPVQGPISNVQTQKSTVQDPTPISSTQLKDGAVIASKLTEGARSWDYDGSISADDHDTISWTSGTIRLQDGTEYNISSDQTGNMGSRTYIYFDTNSAGSDFQTTTSQNTALADGKILVAVADAAPTTIEDAFFLAAFGDMNVESGHVGAKSIKAASIDVATIDAISGDFGTITAGLIADSTNLARFMDLDATGNSDFLHVETTGGSTTFSVQADGDVTFKGTLRSDDVILRTGGSLFDPGGEELKMEGDAIQFLKGSTVQAEIRTTPGGKTMRLIGPIQISSTLFENIEGDDGSARVANVIVSGSTPSGDYAEGTFWAQTT